MNEIVKPNAAYGEAATLIDLKSNLSNVARDVDTLFKLFEDLIETTSNASDLPKIESKKPNVVVLGKRDLAKLPALIEESWMTLDMLQIFLASTQKNMPSRHTAENFLYRVRHSADYAVLSMKLPKGKAKMYKIVEAVDQVAA